MSEWLVQVFGDYYYQFAILGSNELQFLMCALLFSIGMRRRRWFAFRLALGLLIGTVLVVLASRVRTDRLGLPSRLIVTLLQYASALPLLVLCFQESQDVMLKNWCSSVAVKEIGSAVYPLLQYCFGYDSHLTMQLLPIRHLSMDGQWLLYFLVYFLMYFLVWYLVRPRVREEEPFDNAGRHSGILLSIASLLILGTLSAVTSEHRDESIVLYLCTRFFAMSVAAFILMTYRGIEFRSRARADIAMMDHILSEERKQYAQMKENIDIINMHCHDLKHQLADFSGKLTEREISELQSAMDIYDNSIRTGCEALDVVLYIHGLACRQEGIILTCLADGSALSFMRTRHVYALFNNAISNALEAVRKVEEKEKRVIGVTVGAEDGHVEIEITNYYEGTAVQPFTGQSSKKDTRGHGFGTMSMRYIASQYGGTMEVEALNGIYTLHLSIPRPAGAAAPKAA
ncbi:MAG: sensor histidine kinase [Clostridia bacterium]|nr:sensor histidine kinase [Clostridia bacterium]